MAWSFLFRKRIKIGPFFWNFSKKGYTGWGFRFGPITRNVTRGTTSINTPGPGSFQSRKRRR